MDWSPFPTAWPILDTMQIMFIYIYICSQLLVRSYMYILYIYYIYCVSLCSKKVITNPSNHLIRSPFMTFFCFCCKKHRFLWFHGPHKKKKKSSIPPAPPLPGVVVNFRREIHTSLPWRPSSPWRRRRRRSRSSPASCRWHVARQRWVSSTTPAEKWILRLI